MPFVTQNQRVGESKYGAATVGLAYIVSIIPKRAAGHRYFQRRETPKITRKT
jgi:hypothetical protein